ncbi:hypothetical protein [Burkholderia catarinensis]|uniref:hypothetical protein n=1 Tax=Burkholderia catarinensis TaxID=1108140 RepID=UPI001301708E|nr:hypothetical protein [Burkholderia catarinensis]
MYMFNLQDIGPVDTPCLNMVEWNYDFPTMLSPLLAVAPFDRTYGAIPGEQSLDLPPTDAQPCRCTHRHRDRPSRVHRRRSLRVQTINLQAKTRHFYLAETRHLNLGPTPA